MWFRYDNEPGRKAADALMEKYYGRGYEVEDFLAAPGCKDFNEWLVIYLVRKRRHRRRKCSFW